MRRHSIIVRLGPEDDQKIKLADIGSQVTTIQFVDENRCLGFGLDQILVQLSNRGLYPSERAIDLALLAATVMAADTRISRNSESQDSWTREIDLYVPTENPVIWVSNTDLIERMLKFLTGDYWRVFFRSRTAGFENLLNRHAELVHSSFTSVSLFSGGLDSFVGAIDLLEAGENPLFVSHYWDVSTSSQIPCAHQIGKVYGNMEARHVRARIGFPDKLILGSEPEKTTRARSFLFFSLALLAASALDNNTPFYVPENGLISLNVPLDPLRLGAWSTRTTHPFYLARWQDLINGLGISARITNPYRFKTKGEMLSGCANRELLHQYLSSTISCSSFGKGRYKGLPPIHCGYCVPCLIRRAAVNVVFGGDPTKYAIADLGTQSLNSKRAEGEQVRSFQLIYRRLLEHPGFASALIYKSGPLSDYSIDEIADYTKVFRRGVAEVGNFVEKVVVRPA